MSSEFNTNSDSQAFLFTDLMDIFQDLNNLRHNNDLFNDFLQDIRYFDKSFLIGDDFNWNMNDSINNL